METVIQNYTFDASAGTIEFDDYVSIEAENVVRIVNITRGIILYDPTEQSPRHYRGYEQNTATAATNILTLQQMPNTTMADSDKLHIVYFDPDASAGGGGDATAANQDEQTTLLTEIETAVDGIEASLTTLVAQTSDLEANTSAAKATTTPMQARATFTITLASLANGSARQSTMISNSSNYPAALVNLKITSGGAAPTVGTVYEVYLLRSDGTNADDGAGASDAAITIENAPLLGTIVVTATTAKAFYGIFDTAPLGPLGGSWGIAVKNSTGQALSTTEGDHVKAYQYYNPSQA